MASVTETGVMLSFASGVTVALDGVSLGVVLAGIALEGMSDPDSVFDSLMLPGDIASDVAADVASADVSTDSAYGVWIEPPQSLSVSEIAFDSDGYWA